MSSLSRRGFVAFISSLGSIPLVMMSVRNAFAKVTQSSVAYQDSPKDGNSCANCSLFEPPSACKTVDGTISPKAWCKIWAKK
jgi:hypothetical protein